MTTESVTAGQNESEKIWAEMDAADAGGTPAVVAPAAALEQKPAVDAVAKPDDASTEGPAVAADPNATQNTPDTQTLLDKVNGLESQLAGALKRVRHVEGQYGELNGQLKTAKETAASGDAAPTATQIRAAQANPEAMAKLKTDYPEFGAAMEAALEERVSGLQKELKEIREQNSRQPTAVTPADVEALRRELTVERAHAGWTETVKQPEFAGWMHRQPREVQMLAASDSPQDAIRMLDLYSESRKAKPNNQRRLETAAAIPNGRNSSERAKPVEEMTGPEYWAYLDQQEAQQK